MKTILFVLVVLVGAMLATPAIAAQYPRDIRVSWENADLYEDGAIIEAGDLEGVRIEIYRANDTVPVLTATIPASGEGLAQSENFIGAIPRPGTYRIVGYSIVIGGIESVASDPVFRKYIGKPRTIVNVIVTVD